MLEMGARWYDPYLGRWASADTIVPDPGNPQSLNRYSYVRNNPIRYTDPSGHVECEFATGCNQPPKPKIVSREEWGALEPGTHIACGPGGACTWTGWAEGMFDPDSPDATEAGYGYYSDLSHTKDQSLADVLKQVTVHHSGNRANNNMKLLQQQHMFGKGLTDVAYHFAIDSSGVIYEGRNLGVRGAHVRQGNTGKVGILLMGDFEPGDYYEKIGLTVPVGLDWDHSYPTEAQIQSAVDLVRWLDVSYGIDLVQGHGEVNVTDCPGQYCLPTVQILNNVAGER